MKALTLHAPWAHAVAWLGKDIENRSWRPPASVIGTRIAIHAGATKTEAEWSRVHEAWRRSGLAVDDDEAIAISALVCTAVVKSVLDTRIDKGSVAMLHSEAAAIVDSPWFIGPVAWKLTDVRRLDKPIPCKGRLGLWTLPEGVIL